MNKENWEVILNALDQYIANIEEETGTWADNVVGETYSKAVVEKNKGD
jgi:hypothetical protein